MLTYESTDTVDLGPDVELRLSGTIAGNSLPILATELAHALQLRPESLILNVRDCTGMDPNAIRLLLNACSDARVIGSQIVLHHPAPTLIRALAMAGVLRWLMVDYPDAAVASGLAASVPSSADPGPRKTLLQQMAIRRFAGW